jgi:hypothetical protein
VRRALLLPLLLLVTACGLSAESAAPLCGDVERMAVVAQSVPSASFVPCADDLPPGWRVTDVEVRRGTTRLALLSDRSDGRAVEIALMERCHPAGASPTPPRVDGARSYLALTSVSPVYAGTAYDVFPGGCLVSDFAFPRGAHIPLMEELGAAVALVPRRELRVDLRDELGVELEP